MFVSSSRCTAILTADRDLQKNKGEAKDVDALIVSLAVEDLGRHVDRSALSELSRLNKNTNSKQQKSAAGSIK